MINFANEYYIGERTLYEDWSRYDHFSNLSHIEMWVSILADGVGGAANGEYAARIAVGKALSTMHISTKISIPELLVDAVVSANQEVFRLRHTHPKMTTTLIIATVVRIKSQYRLFIANVGDSRAYLFRQRDQSLSLLSLDHTYGKLKYISGGLTIKELKAQYKDSTVMRVLGAKENITVDTGIYLNHRDISHAQSIGIEGLKLDIGDKILLCSDGLFSTPDYQGEKAEALVEERFRNIYNGEVLAKDLIQFTESQHATDNVTVILMDLQGDKNDTQKDEQFSMLSFKIIIPLILVIILLFTVTSLQIFIPLNDNNSFNTETVVDASINEMVTDTSTLPISETTVQITDIVSQTVPAITITATPMVVAIRNGELDIYENSLVDTLNLPDVVHSVFLDIENSESSIFLLRPENSTYTEIEFGRITNDNIIPLEIIQGRVLVIGNGRPVIQTRVLEQGFGIETSSDNSCFNLDVFINAIRVTCLAGDCNFSINDIEDTVAMGYSIFLSEDSRNMTLIQPEDIQDFSLAVQTSVSEDKQSIMDECNLISSLATSSPEADITEDVIEPTVSGE